MASGWRRLPRHRKGCGKMTRPSDHHFDWSDTAIETLRRLWNAEGKTAQQIADVLGPPCTKNSVISKVHRLGLSLRRPSYQPSSPRQIVAPKPRLVRPVIRKAKPMPKMPEFVPAPLPDEIIEPDALMIPLIELTDKTCHFPFGDPKGPDLRFCGLPTQGAQSWCAKHLGVVYVPNSERRRDRQTG